MDALEILVIILSLFLALFLVAGIVLIVLLIKVTRQIKRVTSTAERTATGIEDAVKGINKVTTPAFILKTIAEQLKKHRKK